MEMPEAKEMAAPGAAVVTVVSSITKIPNTDRLSPINAYRGSGLFSMPNNPELSITRDVTVCPSSPSAITLVMLMQVKARF